MLLQGQRILVVEDNALNRAVMKIILTGAGAEVVFASTDGEALEQLQRAGVVHLAVLDLVLSDGVSGYDLCSQIHAVPGCADVPVVAVSAADPAVAIPRTRAQGFAGFIAKPIDRHLFPGQVARIIAGETIWHPGSTTLR